ncbi:MAG: aminotransferase class I/II-fold pyridoxal phosphate-dependent enzyme, partial [Chitinophagales bacterium]|nr:aminotransferase class I/II-fold pyridoxal phosphate-dependent enzyme [Chitinophagales bacterium]
YGQKGEGLAQMQNLHRDIFVRIHTFGKAPGVHGAVVLCNEVTKHFLINYCRPFIFSTAMPLHSLVAIYASYEFMATAACHAQREKLNEVIKFFSNQYENLFGNEISKSNSAIQTVIIPGNDKCRNLSLKLIDKGFEIRPILSPTVPKGKERLRICLHSFNTFEQIEELFISLKKIYNNE